MNAALVAITLLVFTQGPLEAAPTPNDSASSPEQLLGPCAVDMPAPKFRADAELKVLITRFAGADGSSESVKFGAALGSALQHVLPSYMKALVDTDTRKSGFRPEMLQAEYVPCIVSGHEHARDIGSTWGADLVIWGVSQTSTPQDAKELIRIFESKVKNIRVASDNVVNAPGATSVKITGVVNIKVNVPRATATFQTSMTMVNWNGLETDGAASRVAGILDQTFPSLATDQPLALFYLVLGNFAHRTGRFALAARFFEQSTETVFASADHQEFLFWTIADSYARARVGERSIPFARKALDSCPPNDKLCSALYMNNLGWVLERNNHADQAKDLYERARVLSHDEHFGYVEATAMNNIAAMTMLTDPSDSIQLLKSALIIRRDISDLIGEASTLHNLGAAYFSIGDMKTAASYLEQALPLRKRAHDVAGEAATLNQLAEVYMRQSNFSSALQMLDQEEDVNRLLGDKLRELTIVELRYTRALLAKDQKLKTEAALACREWVNSNKSQLSKIGDATVLNNIGKMLYDLGEHRRAIEFYNRAITSFKAKNDEAGEGLSYNNIGKALYALHEYKAALAYYQRSLPLLKKPAGQVYLDYLLHNIGLVNSALHHPQLAADAYEQAFELRQKKGDIGASADTLGALAATYVELGRTEDAIKGYRNVASILANTTPDEARQSLQKALKLAEDAHRDDLVDAVRTELAATE